MRRRDIALVGGLGLIAVTAMARMQATALRRVGVLSFTSLVASGRLRAAFTEGMGALGWREGTNIDYRFVHADGDVDRLDARVGELISQRVEVIVVANAASTRVAQRATTSIPIVMAYIANAVGSGFVTSLARPGGNITGISIQTEEVLGKLVQILHEAAPQARRLAILLNESNPSHALFWTRAQAACAALDLTALRIVASSPAQLDAAVAQIHRQRAQAVVVVGDPLYFAERAKLQTLLEPTRLPVAHGLRESVVGGGLLSYGADIAASHRYAAKFVDKILRGAKPADLPVEQPTTFELVINLKTARALGLVIPLSLLLRADEVIE